MKSIKELGSQYNALQSNIGSSEDKNWEGIINLLFSENFTKVANGETLANSREALKTQIIKCREDAGKWTIHEKELIPSRDNKMCTIHYTISTEKAESFEVIAMLKSENGEKIDSIMEVYYQIK